LLLSLKKKILITVII